MSNTQLISATSFSPTAGIMWMRSLFEQHVSKESLESYRLPCDEDTTVVIAISGGADSTVLSLLGWAYLGPNYSKLRFCFCDTGAEPESCYETLDKIESITGIHIDRISAKHNLFEMIEHGGGFLPSAKARSCTNALKIQPTTKYLKQFKKSINLAGIRSDEAQRGGLQLVYSMEKEQQKSTSAFPFIDLGINKSMVFEILHKSIGIPETYRWRSRSGCFSCFFQRRSELVGLYFNHRDYFEKTAGYEKLSALDKSRWPMQEVLHDQGVRGFYPVPKFVNINTKIKDRIELAEPAKPKESIDKDTKDLFGEGKKKVRIYAAYALYIHPMLSMYSGKSSGIYQQEFVTFSTSKAGLQAALGTYYSFKKSTPVPNTNVEHLNIIMCAIDFPAEVVDTNKPSKDSYTWKPDVAFDQISHVVSNIQALLELNQAREELQEAKRDALLAMQRGTLEGYLDAYEMAKRAAWQKYKAKKQAPKGKVVWEALYRPQAQSKDGEQMSFVLDDEQPKTEDKKARSGLTFDEVPMACIACSI